MKLFDRRALGVCVSTISVFLLFLGIVPSAFAQTAAPTSYSGYTNTDVRTPPNVPPPASANSVMTDPTFGSRILRVTDQNTLGGKSFIPADSGFTRTFNANSTAIKLSDQQGWSWWMEFNPAAFKVGDGSSHPVPHAITEFDARWEWSAVNPDIMYFLKGTTLAKYNKATGVSTTLASTPTGDATTYHVAVVGKDAWVCSAAGNGIQNTFTKIFCVDPNNTSRVKFIDVLARTINGGGQTDPNWPTSGSGATLGIHSLYGSAGGEWLGVTFHGQSWGANGDAVLNLGTNRWSRLTNGDYYWAGHISLGNGKFVNGGGSKDGRDARGAVVRDPDDLMNSSKYQFIMQPASSCCWQDGEHSSWFNSSNNPAAPVLFSRYTVNTSPWLPWMSEILLAATDGSNKVWRVAHTHQGGCYYGQGHAQISNDGRWALFSSYWDGKLGSPAGFDCSSRIDTFLVELPQGGAGSAPTGDDTLMMIDSPASGVVTQPFDVSGWAVNQRANTGTDVDAVHVWAYPAAGGNPIFLGSSYGVSRPDVAAYLGKSQFTNSGYSVRVSGLPAGGYRLMTFGHRISTNNFDIVRSVDVNVMSTTVVMVDAPGPNAGVGTGFSVVGWAADLASKSGSGVNAVHVYVRSKTTGAYTFLGAATEGQSRPDLGPVIGAQFTSAGFKLNVNGLGRGAYELTIFARSALSGQWTTGIVPISVQ